MMNLALAAANVLVAALVSALFVAFATPDRARRSLQQVGSQIARWRWGVLVLGLGVVLLVPPRIPGLVSGRLRWAFYAAGYGATWAGIVLHASATWGADGDPGDGGEPR